jgi:hypothetical protein
MLTRPYLRRSTERMERHNVRMRKNEHIVEGRGYLTDIQVT